jgi:hypothetical protein
MMPGGHGNENPNANYMNGRGFWVFYVLVVTGAHLVLLSIPINQFTVAWVWTATCVGHNAISFWFPHWVRNGLLRNYTSRNKSGKPVLRHPVLLFYSR